MYCNICNKKYVYYGSFMWRHRGTGTHAKNLNKWKKKIYLNLDKYFYRDLNNMIISYI